MGVANISGPFYVSGRGKGSDWTALRVHTFEVLNIDKEGDWRFMAESATGGFNPTAVAKRRGRSNDDILGVSEEQILDKKPKAA